MAAVDDGHCTCVTPMRILQSIPPVVDWVREDRFTPVVAAPCLGVGWYRCPFELRMSFRAEILRALALTPGSGKNTTALEGVGGQSLLRSWQAA